MTHVRTLPYYPQSNRRLERWNKTLKVCATRPRTPLSLDDARRIVEEFVNTYNKERLHSAIGYITPADKLAGREDAIFAERDRKLEDARALRAQRRAGAGSGPAQLLSVTPHRWAFHLRPDSDRKFRYLHLYVILDIFSRYVVGWMVAEHENANLAGTTDVDDVLQAHGGVSGGR